jgi:parallel beta-helix repeat protein
MSETIINVQDEGCVGDGVTNESTALNALFTSIAGAGANTVYFPKGTYLLTTAVFLDGELLTSPIAGLRIFGDPGTIIKAKTPATPGVWGTSGAMFKFRASATPATNVIIENLIFDGGSFGVTADVAMGIYTTAITGLTIRNCTFQNIGNTSNGIGSSPRNDGIMLGDNAPAFLVSMRAKDVLIENCRFVNVVRNGISGLDTDGVTVDNCYFDNIDNSGCDFEPNSVLQFARDLKFTNNTFLNCEVTDIVCIPGSTIRGAVYAAQMEGLKITNNYMDGSTVCGSGALVFDWLDVLIEGNTVIRHNDPGIYVRSSQQVRIRGNHVRDNTNTSGAILVDLAATIQPTDHIIEGNTIQNSAGYGIRCVDLDGGVISSNIIRVYDSSVGSGRTGISITTSASTSRNIAVIGNLVTGGGGVGGVATGGQPIDISSACTRMLVVGNVCQQNGGLASTDCIDFDAASGIIGLNCDEQRSTFPWTSPGGTTPFSGAAVGQTTARKSSMEITVAAGAVAGTLATTSEFITTTPVINLIFSPINTAAAAMLLIAGGCWCHRSATGFNFTHQGNPAGTDAIFQVMAASS